MSMGWNGWILWAVQRGWMVLFEKGIFIGKERNKIKKSRTGRETETAGSLDMYFAELSCGKLWAQQTKTEHEDTFEEEIERVCLWTRQNIYFVLGFCARTRKEEIVNLVYSLASSVVVVVVGVKHYWYWARSCFKVVSIVCPAVSMSTGCEGMRGLSLAPLSSFGSVMKCFGCNYIFEKLYLRRKATCSLLYIKD